MAATKINANDVKSELEMLRLFFPEYSFKYDGSKISSLKVSYTVNFAVNKDIKDQMQITILTVINSPENSLSLNVTAVGEFKLHNYDNFSEQNVEIILKRNAVAIMLPFVRSQVSLLTTQPGMSPILLPPVDVNAMADANRKQAEEKTDEE